MTTICKCRDETQNKLLHPKAKLALKIFQISLHFVLFFPFNSHYGYKNVPRPLHQVLTLDDIDQAEGYKNFKDAFLDFIKDESYEKIFVVTIGENLMFSFNDGVLGIDEYLNYLSLSDTGQPVPDIDSYNALLVYTATGGIRELVKLFSAYTDFETAIRSVLCYDSGYFLGMKHIIEQAFRKPEPYNTILYAIAKNNVRKGQLSQAIGEVNNKADKYCRSLIDSGFLEKKDSNYSFTNSYFELWHKLLYPNSSALHRTEYVPNLTDKFIHATEDLAKKEFVKTAMCHAYENNYGFPVYVTYAGNCTPVPTEVMVDEKPYFFDGVIGKDGRFTFIKVLLGNDLRLDRTGTELLEKAVSQVAPLYDSHIWFYSYNAFCDYPVRLAAQMKYLHLNALERLKWR